jgi:hypothetical protein
MSSQAIDALTSLDHVKLVNTLAEGQELTALKEFFSKCSSYTTTLITEASKKSATQSSAMAGNVFLQLENSQLIEPRGRFNVSFGEGGVVIDGKVD